MMFCCYRLSVCWQAYKGVR